MRLAILLLPLLAACTGTPKDDDTGAEADADTDADTDTDTDTDVSFENDVWPMLEADCAGCHSDDSWHPGFLLSDSATAYTSLLTDTVDNPGSYGNYVVAGDVDASLLIDKLEASPAYGGDQMPKDGTAWSAEEVQVVKDWITQGAIDN